MTTEEIWHHAYLSAILETDWTRIQERLQVAESEIRKRQHVLSMDHGGTPEERQVMADALNGMRVLRAEVGQWQTQQSPGVKVHNTRLDRLLENSEASPSPPGLLQQEYS